MVVDPGLGRGAVVEAGMGSLAVVKHFDVFDHGHPCPSFGREDLFGDTSVFQAGESVSATALSQQIPVRSIDWVMSAAVQ